MVSLINYFVLDFKKMFKIECQTLSNSKNTTIHSSSLTKDYNKRPKYPELLGMDFIKMYENADIDVACWYASVREQQLNNTELRR